MSVKFKDQYTAEGKRLKKTMEELTKLECFIGIQHDQDTSEDGVDVCDYAAWNELGTSNGIPSRPFIRNSVDLHRDEINSRIDEIVEKILDGATAEQALNEMGLFQKSLIQGEINDGNYIPNSPVTIKKKSKRGKRSAHPLIDTGRMRGAVNYQIGKKGEFK